MSTYVYLQKLSVKYKNLRKKTRNTPQKKKKLPVIVCVELSGAVLIMLIPKSNT